MGRKRVHGSNAERQAAYRLRKRNAGPVGRYEMPDVLRYEKPLFRGPDPKPGSKPSKRS